MHGRRPLIFTGLLVLLAVSVHVWRDRGPSTVEVRGSAVKRFGPRGVAAAHLAAANSGPAAETVNAAAHRQGLLARLAYAQAWEGPLPPELAAFREWTVRFAHAATSEGRTALEPEGVALAHSRRAVMLDLIKSDPQRALAVTVPAVLRRQLPTAVLTELESRVAGTGDYSVQVALYESELGRRSTTRHVVSIGSENYTAHSYGRRADQMTKYGASLHGVALEGELALHESPLRVFEPGEVPASAPAAQCPVSAEPVAALAAGAEVNLASLDVVEAFGRIWEFCGMSADMMASFEQRLDAGESQPGPHVHALVLGPDGATPTTAADAPTAWTTGAKQVLMIRVDFSDMPGDPILTDLFTQPSITAQYALDWMNTNVAPAYRDMSYGKTTLAPTVSTKLYRMPQPAATYAASNNINQLYADAQSLAGADFNIPSYDRVMVLYGQIGAVPGSNVRFDAGVAELGGRHVWLAGSLWAIYHELGHTFGLNHANLWSAADGNPISPSGTTLEYGDPFDIMGGGSAIVTENSFAHFNHWFKNRLGWMADTQVQTVTTSGTYRVFRFDHAAASGTLALKVAKDSTRDYWIGLRRSIAANASLSHGAYILWGYKTNQQSNLLDLTTPGAGATDAALALGTTFTDFEANLSIRPVAEGGSAPNEYLDVEIKIGLSAGPPAITAAPTSRLVQTGQPGVFAVAAEGNPKPSGYQWQRLPAGSNTWSNLSNDGTFAGTTTATLVVNSVTAAMNGDQFRCNAISSAGSATSTAATLAVGTYGVFTLAGLPFNRAATDGIGTVARFYSPTGVAVDDSGNLYVCDRDNYIIRKITPTGVVTTLAGLAGARGIADGAGSVARFTTPTNCTVDRRGYVFVTDVFGVRQITPAGVVTWLAGISGIPGNQDGTGSAARFNTPNGIVVDGAGNLFVADSNNGTIRKITPAGDVTTLPVGRFFFPCGLAVDGAGNIFVNDRNRHVVYKITPTNTVTAFAGLAGTSGSQDGTGSAARFNQPNGLAIDSAGNLYVADANNYKIRKVTPAGVVTTLAGISINVLADSPPQSTEYADGPAPSVRFSYPVGVAVDNAGNVYVTDQFANTVRKYVQAPVPQIQAQAQSQTITAGQPVTFSVTATSTSALSYQWQKNGANIIGATGSSYSIGAVRSTDVGSYAVVITNADGGSVTSSPAVLTVGPNNPGRIVNLSILTNITASEPFFTVGTVLGGAGTSGGKSFLIRAAGPSLTPLGVVGALADPTLSLFSGQTVLNSNDNWGGTTTLNNAFTQVGAFAFTSSTSKDAALLTAQLAGGYTVRIGGVSGATGTVIAELYDATPSSAFTATTPRLINVSVLKQIGAGDILTAGFVIGGATSKTVLIRAVGPTLGLAPFGVPGVMADPKLDLFSGQTVINSNDDWGGGSALATAFANVGAFALPATSKDAALLVTLSPGNYTAQVSGVGGTGGIALVEVYEMP